jgi:hypothetical protein
MARISVDWRCSRSILGELCQVGELGVEEARLEVNGADVERGNLGGEAVNNS